MNIQRFIAPTAREALAKARLAFGDGTLILSNRPTASGIEVVATGEDTLAALDQSELAGQSKGKNPSFARKLAEQANEPMSPVEDDVTQLAMSTLSFQDYVRERMLRRRHEASTGQTGSAPTPPALTAPRKQPESLRAAPTPIERPAQFKSAPTRPVPRPAASPVQAAQAPMSQGIADELHAMKTLIEDRFNTLTWLGQARQNPIQSNLMLKLIRAGYSPTLARTVLEHMPEEFNAAESVRWVMDILERNLKTDAASAPIHTEGGIFALIGSTGVGKTTTAAKLAGLCAQKYGAASVGLITLDTYRVGAHEQLRSYGRMLGVVAHLAHDQAALQDLLNLLTNKKMVLVDTTGLAPSDPRKRDMLEVLNLPKVNRLLVLNATSHGDTLDDVVSSFKSSGIQQAILSKIDEAAKVGPALDAIIRHQLVLRGVTMGQKVPEDWEPADAAKLVRLSMRAPVKSAFDPKPEDLGFSLPSPHPAIPGGLMLETCVNQAAGLQSMALQASPRVIAMASHGDQQGEMPLLWGLCSTLVDCGYPVMVLDANAVESDNNPGLLQLLDDASWRDEALNEPRSWSVMPAALGLQRVSHGHAARSLPLDPLGGLLQNFGVIVIYARAEVLVRLLRGSGIQPLLTVSAIKTSPVTAYQALKQMLLNADLHPTVARLVINEDCEAPELPPRVDNLSECAMAFLGYRVDPLTIRTRQPKEQAANDVSRLALRLLENAMPLYRHPFVESH